MADVTLHYKAPPSAGGVQPLLATLSADPPVVSAAMGEAISFHLSPGSPQGQIVITFHEPQFFSAPAFQSGDQDVVVACELPHRTFYKCELHVNGELVGRGDLTQGGGIEPPDTP